MDGMWVIMFLTEAQVEGQILIKYEENYPENS